MGDIRRTYFSHEWLNPATYPEWYTWLRENPSDKSTARCILCCKTIQLSNMGLQAISSHHSGKIHQKKYASMKNDGGTRSQFLQKKAVAPKVDATKSTEATAPVEPLPENPCKCNKERVDLGKYHLKPTVLKSEILYAMTAVSIHLSSRGVESLTKQFPLMFLDSSIAQQFKMGKANFLTLQHWVLTQH